MKTVNLSRQYKKYLLRSYKWGYRQIESIKEPEEKAGLYIGTCMLVCFSIGMICDITEYVLSASYLLLTLNLGALAVYAATSVLYVRGRMRVPKALMLLLFTVQANISISIGYNHYGMAEGTSSPFSYDLFIGFLVCMLAALTIRRNYVYLLCIMPLASLAAVLIVHPAPWMMTHFPSLCLAYVSPPVLLTHIRKFLWGMVPRLQAKELFKVLEGINERHRLALTANEVRLCCLILEDKSIQEISHILYINESSVRANRSRIRKKLKLDKEMNLKAHLLMLVSGKITGCRNNFRQQDDDI